MKIVDYSTYDNYTVKSETENISTVIDKLIRLTAKITEHYASDIVYDINMLNRHLADKESYDMLLYFREMGVSSYNTHSVLRDDNELLWNDYIQVWRLTYDPETGVTMLKRVDVRKE